MIYKNIIYTKSNNLKIYVVYKNQFFDIVISLKIFIL